MVLGCSWYVLSTEWFADASSESGYLGFVNDNGLNMHVLRCGAWWVVGRCQWLVAIASLPPTLH